MPIQTHIDHLGRVLPIRRPIKRIISLVPSQTELLIELGLQKELVGITNFCIHPAKELEEIQKIGGTKTPNIELIKSLNPDLIIGNKEENNLNDVENLARLFPVWISDVNTFDDNFKLIMDIGYLFDKVSLATSICSEIQVSWDKLKIRETKTCLYFIWRKPYMVAGRDTFINSILSKSGYENIMETSRYPSLNESELKNMNPEIVFLSSEPYAFREKHIAEFTNVFPNSIIKIVDGELFSWYGPRQKRLPKYLSNLKISL
jgi:ABC-type Fe3+-hydroxamate transport system substrate-binding protein